ncbi:zinc finger protein 782-like [Achroia grisella]|uniref:zinc finger protein 782-like n=1 Tax=Achroia grisella TaxID=688607 RepID=UPI0027D2C343|nr:zinc finger protein 782-like [Achroia grisella]
MTLNNAIRKILSRSSDFCCLCFETINGTAFSPTNEVVVNVNQTQNSFSMSDVLSTVVGKEILNYVSTFETLCTKCTQSAINSYTFMVQSKENSELLCKVLNTLKQNIDDTIEEQLNCKTLFVSVNTETFTGNQHYDNKRPVYNASSAVRRYRSLINNKQKLIMGMFCPRRIKKEVKKEKLRHTVPIATSDMLYDKNDQQTIKCKECLKIYPTVLKLRTHYIRVHAPKVFKCTECPRKYGSLSFLQAHKEESHCTIVCSECGKTFHNRNTLRMHEMGHHMRFVCQHCGRIYKNKNTFKKHIELDVCSKKTRASPSEAKFTCDYCNKKYTQKVSLRVHIQFEHGNYKVHECKWCKKRFWAQSRLKAHIVKHTQEKNFHCSTCNRNFVTKESLLYHTRIHTGEKPYECSECDSRFLSASRRAEHVKRHHRGATIQCDICNSKFNSMNFLQKHRRTHFKNEKSTQQSLLLSKEKNQLGDDVKSFVMTQEEYQTHQLLPAVFDNDFDSRMPSDEEIYLEISNQYINK